MLNRLIWLLCLFTATLASAQGADEQMPFNQILTYGGTTMKVLIFLSLFATFMVVYFLLSLRLSVLMPDSFRDEAESLASKGDVEALAVVCQDSGCAGARIIGAAAQLLHDRPDVEYRIIRDVIEDEGGRQSSILWQRIQYLQDIAVIAPMVGLLGTVLGMLRAFIGVAGDFAAVKPMVLISGVSQALVTTAGGLILGIAGMILYAFFRGRVSRLISRLEERSNSVLYQFINRGEKGGAAS